MRSHRPSKPFNISPWVQRTVDGHTHAWAAVAMSQNGAVIVAADANDNGSGSGKLWHSTDSGATWAALAGAGARVWQSVALSSDGSHIVAGFKGNGTAGTAGIVVSGDSGASFSTPTLSADATNGLKGGILVAISGDGAKMAVADTGFEEMWLSTNSGSSFPAIAVPTVGASA